MLGDIKCLAHCVWVLNFNPHPHFFPSLSLLDTQYACIGSQYNKKGGVLRGISPASWTNQFYDMILLRNSGFIILLLSAFQFVYGESMVNCPECGEPLVKDTKSGKYNCENERCSVIYVKRPYNIALRTVVRSSLRKR